MNDDSYTPYAYHRYTCGVCSWIDATMTYCGESSIIYHNVATYRLLYGIANFVPKSKSAKALCSQQFM